MPSYHGPRVANVPPGPRPAQGLWQELSYFNDLKQDVLGTLGQRFATFGDLHYGRIRDREVYATCDPELVHEVLVLQAARFGKRRMDLEVLGNGLLLSEGDFWRRQRRRIQPGFRHESIQRYALGMAEEIERFLAGLRPGAVIELRATMLELTLRIVCRALFGQSYRGDPERLAHAMRVLQEAVLVPKIAPAWLPTPGRVWRSHMRARVDREVFALIDDPDIAPDSLLAELRAAVDEAGSMTREQLRDEAVTLFLAGHETTALALVWTFYLVALQPEVDAALGAELASANAARLGAAELERLDLCQRVLKESLRLYPPVYVIPRLVQKPTKLAEYWLAPGAEIWLWIYFMQRDPRWFSLPDRFDPQRFAPGGEASKHPKAYAPFGAGTRSCIGRHFATLEAAMVLASVLRRYRLELVDGRVLRCRPRVTLAPARPVHVRLHPR
jgi:cytochrome P450